MSGIEPSRQARVPVTVLTGYLGAGKTTLLNQILTQTHGQRFAVVINEFAELGIDGDLVVSAQEEVITLANGCICCTVRADLLATIKTLIARDEPLDGIIVETTGLADPAPVIQSFFAEPAVNAATRLDAVVTVVDARHLPAQLRDGREAEAQIAAADLILINKSDLVATEHLEQIEVRIRALNRFAQILQTSHSRLPVTALLDRHAFDLQRVVERLPAFAHDDHHHGDAEAIESLSMEIDRPVDQDRFLRWIDSLLALHGDDIMRIKGILNIAGTDQPFVFQAVHRIMDGDFRGQWPILPPRSRLVVIGRNLDPVRLRRNFQGCQARPDASNHAAHAHLAKELSQ